MGTKISRQLFLCKFVWIVVLGVLIALFGHLEIGEEKGLLSKYFGASSADTAGTLDMEYLYWTALGVILVMVGFFLWLSLRLSVKRIVAEFEETAAPRFDKKQQQKTPAPQPAAKEKKTSAQDDQRRALHLLCLLQREGRLVDFLTEDLRPYDDAQIGATARSIQESCQKSLNKYLSLKAVIDQEEGEAVTIKAGFDANAIKLTGKVTGEPPFEGILEHCGWRVTNFALPALSGSQNPSIVFPAEVEIG
jgi:hypothetical protein